MGKFYAEAQGKSNLPLILESWDECKKEVIGCKGAIYKSFGNRKEAENFISSTFSRPSELKHLSEISCLTLLNSIFCSKLSG